MAVAQPSQPHRMGGEPRLFNRHEYHRMAECGVLDPDERVELLEGIVYRKFIGEPRRWTREEYHRMGECGILGPDERLELLEGEIVHKMSPQNRRHAIAIHRTAKVLEAAFEAGFFVQQQVPAGVGADSEPEPDLLVLPGEVDDYPDHPNPADAVLLVEISDSSLRLDQTRKSGIYSGAGAPEYWIVDLRHRRLEVRRDPLLGAGADPIYQTVLIFEESEVVSPLAAPAAIIQVADLLPVVKKDQENVR